MLLQQSLLNFQIQKLQFIITIIIIEHISSEPRIRNVSSTLTAPTASAKLKRKPKLKLKETTILNNT